MDEFQLIGIFLFVLFLMLGTGIWVGLALLGVAFVGMELFTSRNHCGKLTTMLLPH